MAKGQNKKNLGSSTASTKEAQKIVDAVRGNFEQGLVTTLSTNAIQNVQGLSWGCPSLNYICTRNPFVGLVSGRVYEIFGMESSGKTTLCLHAIAEAQRSGLVAAFVDVEHALDMDYAVKLGINPEELIFSQPDYGEQAFEVILKLVELGVRLIVCDSVAMLIPLAELDASMESVQMGLSARMMGKALRKVTPQIKKSQSTVLFINQTRQKIGVVFGSNLTTPGGNALKFASSIRLHCVLSTAKAQAIRGTHMTLLGKSEKERLGSTMTVRVPKNKLAPPFGETEINLYYGRGLDKVMDYYNFALKFGWIEKGRGTFNLPATKGRKSIRVTYDKLSEYIDVIQDIIQTNFKINSLT